MVKIGIFGLGDMGAGVYKLLANTEGLQVFGYDIDPAKSKNTMAETLNCDIWYLFLPNSETVRSFMNSSVNMIRGKTLLIGTTLPVGFTDRLVEVIKRKSGLVLDRDYCLAYCLERSSEGCVDMEFRTIDRVIGATAESFSKVAPVFYNLFKTKSKIMVTDCKTAEAVKLSEASYRTVNIAFANTLARVCQENGIDVADVIRFANTHPRVSIHSPGLGAGGKCLEPNTKILFNELEDYPLIKEALVANNSMPEMFADMVASVVGGFSDPSVGVLGTAFKPNSSSGTNSPAKTVITRLLGLGYRVKCFDPYCGESFGALRRPTLHECVEGVDCVAVATGHDIFRNLDLALVSKAVRHKNIIDGPRVVDPRKAVEAGFKYCGIGYGSCTDMVKKRQIEIV